jgi:Flp pilus assembly protein TadD
VAAACLALLAGCETSTKFGDLLSRKSDNPLDFPAPSEQAQSPDPATTGTVATTVVEPVQGRAATILGKDPNDDLSLGKKQYRAGNFGVAEKYFRRAVEFYPRDAEAWVGLAASYDRLRKFDLADRAYKQAITIIGPTPEVLNNQGYSYILRGDYAHARETLLSAQVKAPDNPYIRNNLELLDKAYRSGKAVQ